MQDLEAALSAHLQEFMITDHAEILNASGPYSIVGFRTVDGEKRSVPGRLYKTRNKNVLIAVFIGVLRRDPPLFGRSVLFSSGGPGSTVKMECLPEQLEGLLKVVAEIAESDPSVQDATEYRDTFLKNITRECSFDQGLIVPDLTSYAIVLTVQYASAEEEHRLPPEQDVQQDLKRQRTEDDASSSSAQVDASEAVSSAQNDVVSNQESQQPLECMVCLDAPPSTLVLPCMHKVVCESCSEKLKESSDRKTCLYCRSEIQGISYESGETFEL